MQRPMANGDRSQADEYWGISAAYRSITAKEIAVARPTGNDVLEHLRRGQPFHVIARGFAGRQIVNAERISSAPAVSYRLDDAGTLSPRRFRRTR